MAIYGVDVYGRATYGTPSTVLFDVSPFTATQPNYEDVVLHWSVPGGSYTGFRLVRNNNGYPANEGDGTVLIDIPDISVTSVPISYYDAATQSRFQYYSIFVYASSAWVRAGDVVLLCVKDHGYTQRLSDLLPDFFKRGDLSLNEDEDEGNAALTAFLSLFGFHLDQIATEYDSLLTLWDARKAAAGVLPYLVGQLGVTYTPSISPRLQRVRAKYATHIQRLKGTQLGLRILINAITGWDADISSGANRMGDADVTRFAHPAYPAWDATMTYLTNDVVSYSNYVYKAAASSRNVAPTGAASSNSSWTYLATTTVTNEQRDSTTGALFTWEMLSFTAGATPSTATDLMLVKYASNPANAADNTVNLGRFKNATGVTASLGVHSVAKLSGQTSLDPGQVMSQGVVLANSDAGAIFSASAQVANNTARTSKVFIEWYDDSGNLITTSLPVTNASHFDSFSVAGALNGGSQTDVTKTYYNTYSGTWTKTTGGYAYAPGAGDNTFRYVVFANNQVNGFVAATIRRFPSTDCGLVAQFQDANNCYRVGKTKVEIINGGVVSTVSTFAAPFDDGDRMGVSVNGTTMTVYKNGTQIWTGTISTTFASGVQWGIWSK